MLTLCMPTRACTLFTGSDLLSKGNAQTANQSAPPPKALSQLRSGEGYDQATHLKVTTKSRQTKRSAYSVQNSRR